MLSRGASLGDNLAALEAQLTSLHAWLLTAPGQPPASAPVMSLAQRLAALQARAAGDSRLASLLDLYGLSHPALRLVRGTAWAGRLDAPIGTEVVIELRETDSAGQELAVVGRVTLHAGLDKIPPAPNILDQLAVSSPGDAHRLAGPVFPTKLFDALTVADFNADRTNSFVLDDNDRNAVGGVPFTEGSQYYYFVAAADALGRPGDVSPGLPATMCRNIPPPIPSRLKVTVPWNATDGQYWDISWMANPAGVGTPTSRYEVRGLSKRSPFRVF